MSLSKKLAITDIADEIKGKRVLIRYLIINGPLSVVILCSLTSITLESISMYLARFSFNGTRQLTWC